MSDQTETIHQLFLRYLEVCNRAMAAHGQEFPYKYIWEAAETRQALSGFRLAIYNDEPMEEYVVHLRDKHIEIDEANAQQPELPWRLNKSYLRQVVENAEDYIEQPGKLNWDWLKQMNSHS